MFVCFEGIDGAGKSTQAHMLYAALKDSGRNVELVRDPGTTRLGDAVRSLILECDVPISGKAQALLFSAARAELSAYIREKIADGALVICDRWLLSTLVYQTSISPQLILDIFDATSIIPDICFLLDVHPEEADSRRPAAQRKDRYERADLSVKHARREAYCVHAATPQCAKKVIVLNAGEPEALIHEAVLRIVDQDTQLNGI